MSSSSYALEDAHIVSELEGTWFHRNNMTRYGNLEGIYDKTNLLLMRSDIHMCFLKNWFVIVPKMASSDSEYVTHVISLDAEEFCSSYHNQILRLPRVSKPYLFARFAWAIFRRLKLFFRTEQARWVLRVSGVHENGKIQQVREEMSYQRLIERYRGVGSGLSTPSYASD